MLTYGKTGTAPGTMVLTIPSGGAFGAIPNDFDVSRAHLDYQRFYHGWIPGTLSEAAPELLPASYEEAVAELQVYRSKLAAEKAVADLEHTKSSRTWMIVGGVVGILGLAVSVIALTRNA